MAEETSTVSAAVAKVKPLPLQVQNQLRSGIVITTPAQCIEELTLNSLDAGATCIAVRIDLLSFKLQVVDNGIGISKEDMHIIGSRYCTSKCSNIEDLQHNLKWYGFRGEALSSIMNVSAILDVTSRIKDVDTTEAETYCKMFTKGTSRRTIVSKLKRPTHGTTVTVLDFMYNMPVRRNKINEALDLEDVRRALECIALMNPQCSFTLRNDVKGMKILQTYKATSICDVFANLFSTKKSSKLILVSHTYNTCSFEGYVGTEPHNSKGLQFLYVNKRLVLQTKVHKIINAVFSKTILCRSTGALKEVKSIYTSPSLSSTPLRSTDRYGVFILNLICSPSEYDICFEPRKTVIEFKDWQTVLKCIEEGLVTFFKKENLLYFLEEPSIEGLCEIETSDIPILSEPTTSFGKSLSVQEISKTVLGLPARGNSEINEHESLDPLQSHSSSPLQRPDKHSVAETMTAVDILQSSSSVSSNSESGFVTPPDCGIPVSDIPPALKNHKTVPLMPSNTTFIQNLRKISLKSVSEKSLKLQKFVYEMQACSKEKVKDRSEISSDRPISVFKPGKVYVITQPQVPLAEDGHNPDSKLQTTVIPMTDSYSGRYEDTQSDTAPQLSNTSQSPYFSKSKNKESLHDNYIPSLQVTKKNKRDYSQINAKIQIPSHNKITIPWTSYQKKDVQKHVRQSKYNQDGNSGEILPGLSRSSKSSYRRNIYSTFDEPKRSLPIKADNESSVPFKRSKEEFSSPSLSSELRVSRCSRVTYHEANNNDVNLDRSVSSSPEINVVFNLSVPYVTTDDNTDVDLNITQPFACIEEIDELSRNESFEHHLEDNLIEEPHCDTLYIPERKSYIHELPVSCNVEETPSKEVFGDILLKSNETTASLDAVTTSPLLYKFNSCNLNDPSPLYSTKELRVAEDDNDIFQLSTLTELSSYNTYISHNYTTAKGDISTHNDSEICQVRPQSEDIASNDDFIPNAQISKDYKASSTTTNYLPLFTSQESKLHISNEASNSHGTSSGISDNWVIKFDKAGVQYFVNHATGMATYEPYSELTEQDSVDVFTNVQTLKAVLPSMSTFMDDKKVTWINRRRAEGYSFDPSKNQLMRQLELYPELRSIKWKDGCSRPTDGGNNSSIPGAFDWQISDEVIFETEVSKTYGPSNYKLPNFIQPFNFTKTMLETARIIGQWDCKFIVSVLTMGDNNDAKELLVLFDQHAVHERIRLENLIKENQVAAASSHVCIKSMTVTPPLEVTLSESDVRLLVNFQKNIENVGVTYEQNSLTEILVHSVPACFVQKESSQSKNVRETVLEELLYSLLQEKLQSLLTTRGGDVAMPKAIMNVLCSQACRGAIKFGDSLSQGQCEELIAHLADCQTPFQCAHGRPVLTSLANLSILTEKEKKGHKMDYSKFMRLKIG